MDQNDHKDVSGENKTLKKLASAQELRGKKSGSGKEGTGKKRKLGLSLICLVVVLGLAVGAMYLSGLFKPAEEPADDTAASDYVSNTVKLNSRSRSEVASVKIELPDQETYTIVNNNVYDENGSKQDLPEGQKAYVIEGLEEFDLDQSTADTIIGYGANLTASSMISDSVDSLADYGLDTPRATGTKNDKDGQRRVRPGWSVPRRRPAPDRTSPKRTARPCSCCTLPPSTT